MDDLVADLDVALAAARDLVTTGAFPARLVVPRASHVPQPSFVPQPSYVPQPSVSPIAASSGAPAPVSAQQVTDTNAEPFDVSTHPSTPSEERLRAAAPVAPQATEKLAVPAGARTTGPPPPLSQVAEWRFDRRVDPARAGRFYAAAFTSDGMRALAFGADGIAVLDRGRWVDHPRPPPWFHPEAVWAATAARDGSIFVAGRHGLVARVRPDGTMSAWRPHPYRTDLRLRGIEVTEKGWLSVVGATDDGKGVIGWVGSRGLLIQEVERPLHAICTVASHTQIACGTNGTLMSFTQDRSETRSVGAFELFSITPLAKGAVVVGDEARAFFVDENLGTSMELTETESALSVVTTSDDGSAWAGSSRGRILRRDTYGRWERLTPSWGVEPPILALWTRGPRVRAIAGDGSVISGWRKAE